MSAVLERPFKALVVDDHPMIRQSVSSIINNIPSVVCCDQAANGLAALEKCRSEHYDIIFLDICMPVMDGLTAMHHIRNEFPQSRVVILTMQNDTKQFIELIELGVSGYLLKDTDDLEITKAITLIMEGSQYFTPYVFDVWTDYIYKKKTVYLPGKSPYLSLRELEVLHLICQQMSASEISEKLYVSEATINNHRTSIMKKTGIHNTVGLVIYAIRNGLFKP